MILAERMLIPDAVNAILWDMDGVLLDTLTFDYELCNRLLQKHLSPDASVPRSAIREYFPYDLPEFWKRLVASATEGDQTDHTELLARLVEDHEQERREAVCPINDGIDEVLQAAHVQGLKLAVVSNNPTVEVEKMLERSGIRARFDKVIGNDLENIQKKPAPDAYLLAARQLNVEPARCVVVEDSLLGAEAGHKAGCFVIGVATGADDLSTLAGSPFIDLPYTSFRENSAVFTVGNVTKKHIATPNEFVSHMVEHIAWRMGCSVSLDWNNTDWFALGRKLGETVTKFDQLKPTSAVLGMIDDGSAEVALTAAKAGELVLTSTMGIDLDWFLKLRCEQLAEGTPLVEMLEGLAAGASLKIEVVVASLEDPHHTWEGIYRSVGVALSRMYLPSVETMSFQDDRELQSRSSDSGWTVFGGSLSRAEVVRETAETKVRVAIDCSSNSGLKCQFEVADSIYVEGFRALLDEFCQASGISMEVEFLAKFISSSHVVMEDIGMVLGRALKEVLMTRMEEVGVNGAGCSVKDIDDLKRDIVRVGISVEGRKFLQWVPFTMPLERVKRELIIGQTVGDGLFSEDLDDFLDGLAGGLAASILVHIQDCGDPEEFWFQLYRGLGLAVADALSPNPPRKGVPPGVKATLA